MGSLVANQNEWDLEEWEDCVTVVFCVGDGFFPLFPIPLDPYLAMVVEASYALWCHDLLGTPKGTFSDQNRVLCAIYPLLLSRDHSHGTIHF